MADKDTIKIIEEFRTESEDAMGERLQKNRQNLDAYASKQDWSHKAEGQSREFLPMTAETVEQLSSFVKKALSQFGDWFSVTAPLSPISEENIREIMRCYLENLADGDTIHVKLSDGTKTAALEAYMVFKVKGSMAHTKQNFVVEGDSVVRSDDRVWKLDIPLLKNEEYKPDPTGRGRYEIHEIEKDLWDVQALTKVKGLDGKPVYKPSEVDKIVADFTLEEETAREGAKNKDDFTPKTRKRVKITEFWGTLPKEDGSIDIEKALVVIANDKYILRKEPFPFWHGESPFVKIPLIRIPHSVFNRALYDQGVPLNLAMNQLFNLILDGGIASVWGVRQLRSDLLEDPAEVSGGISQGRTLTMVEDAPANAKVLEQVTEGNVPTDALAVFNLLESKFNSSVLTNDIRSGQIPSKQVRATEVLEASNSQAVTLEGITNDMQLGIEKLLKKAWLTILQNADDLEVFDVGSALTAKETLILARMTPAERFTTMGQGCMFKVTGLSGTLQKSREFQRLLALTQVVAQNPLIAPAAMKRYSPDKILNTLMKSININPEDLEREVEDENQRNQEVEADLAIAERLGLNGNQQGNVSAPGEPGVASEINQESFSTGGL